MSSVNSAILVHPIPGGQVGYAELSDRIGFRLPGVSARKQKQLNLARLDLLQCRVRDDSKASHADDRLSAIADRDDSPVTPPAQSGKSVPGLPIGVTVEDKHVDG
jgi:hypothetical protein